jgi:pimeloyl-ACP methyl ester carboxylesterase
MHLATSEVGLSTHVTDIVNVLLFENLRDVVLVGHSYGGMVITGVADRVHHTLGDSRRLTRGLLRDDQVSLRRSVQVQKLLVGHR